MRLAQIARKLKVKTSEVVAFVDQKFGDQIVHAPNTRIPDEYVNAILEHFTVHQEEKSEEIDSPTQSPTPEQIEETQEVQAEVALDNEQAESQIEEAEETEETEEAEELEETEELNIEDGVIKAPKVEVTGVKVVGKIDLPGDKAEETETKSEEKSEEEIIETATPESNIEEVEEVKAIEELIEEKIEVEKPVEPVKDPVQKKVVQTQNSNKNRKSLTYEEERSLAQQEYRNELKKKKEIDKKNKKANYERMMQERLAKQAPKKSKGKKSKIETSKPTTKVAVEKIDEPTTLWGKFIRWLNN